MSKKAVKKGSASPADKMLKQITTLVNAYNAMSQTQEDKLVLSTVRKQMQDDMEIRHHSRVWMSDMMSVALGRMGFREKRFSQLDTCLTEVVKEFDKEFGDDFKIDPEMVYARECFERELKSYTGSMYTPENERYR